MKGTSKTSQAGKANKSMTMKGSSPSMKMYSGLAVSMDAPHKQNYKKQVDTMPGQKSMSKAHMPMTQGKMSTEQGVVKAGPSKGMINPGDRLGAGQARFENTQSYTAPCDIKGKK